ncbi:KGK domain-containing protein [Gloeothece verrucosa]|nr:KGK domain-containing protein [Gloeothece verrucosa]
MRLTLEFEPDEPENKEPPSPLDDIRQSINQ